MIQAEFSEAHIAQYELEVPIDATCDRVWRAMFEETNSWWPQDSHVLGESSIVTLDAQAGGGLIERTADGASLLWATVHMCQAEEFVLYLILHTAPDWGGPMVSTMKIALAATSEASCVLKVNDAIVGRVNEVGVQQLQQGWLGLFDGGLKNYVENVA